MEQAILIGLASIPDDTKERASQSFRRWEIAQKIESGASQDYWDKIGVDKIIRLVYRERHIYISSVQLHRSHLTRPAT